MASEAVDYSGWMFTDATRLADCPKCKAKAGSRCRFPSGGFAKHPHCERVAILKRDHPNAIKAATKTIKSANEVLNGET